MSDQKKNITLPLSQAVLQAYLEGTLTPTEKAQVEDIIEQEPYYKEVLEGMRWVDESFPTTDRLAKLQASIDAKITSRSTPIVSMSKYIRWAAAAIVLMAVVTAGLWISGQLDREDPVLAQQIKSTQSLPNPNITVDTATESAIAPPPPAPSPEAPVIAETTLDTEEVYDEEVQSFDLEDSYIMDESYVMDDTEPEPAVELSDAPIYDPVVAVERQETDVQLTAPATEINTMNGSTQYSSTKLSTAKATPLPLAGAWEAYQNGQFRKARRLLTEAIETQPTQEAYWLLGQSHLGLADTTEAMAALENALTLPGTYTDTAQVQLELLR